MHCNNNCEGLLYKGEIDDEYIVICSLYNYVTLDKWMMSKM